MENYKPEPQLLQNQIILVTGASTGIGREAAYTYAKYGATVILLARRINLLEKLYDEITEANFPIPAIYPCNLATASPNDFNELASTIRCEFGRLDGILHNAAKLGTLTPIEFYDVREWYSVMQTNLNAPFMLTRALLPLLHESQDASIIFTEDDVGTCGKAYWGAYSIAKFGTTGLRQILAEELEHSGNIRVNSINPGAVKTAMRAKAYPAENPASLHDAGKLMPAYLYLMGADSHGLNGQCLNILSAANADGQLFDITSTL